MKDNIEIKFQWKDIDINNVLQFPAIYRFIFYHGNNKKIYIGETSNLKRRYEQYNELKAHSSQTTNLEIQKLLDEYKDKSKMQYLEVSYLRLNNKLVINNNQNEILKNSFIRKFLENYFIIKSQLMDRKIIVNKKG